jgi:predicted nucleotidyltransferase component of viral defense system
MVERLGPLKPRLDRLVHGLGVTNDFVYRDWALTYILAGLGALPELDWLVFKGGTALRKCLVPNWRYSLDLDFSTATPAPVDCETLTVLVRKAMVSTSSLARELVGDLEVNVEHKVHRDQHPHGQCQLTLRITIPGGSKTQAKMEVTLDEPIYLPVTTHPISHLYPPEPSQIGAIRVYDVNEVAAEKLRAYLQSGDQLAHRGWVAGRSRDTWDLALLHRDKVIDAGAIARILRRKCAVRNMSFQSVVDFQSLAVRKLHATDWDKSLLPTIARPTDISFEYAIGQVDNLLAAIFDSLG